MKVIIMTSYGGERLPAEFKANYENPLWRMDKDLIERIEKSNWVDVEDESEIIEVGKNYRVKKENGALYVYDTPDYIVKFITFEIADVDISRPWCIEDYDGSENIKYLDNYVCISKEYNYYDVK
jgi:hypothetical protein